MGRGIACTVLFASAVLAAACGGQSPPQDSETDGGTGIGDSLGGTDSAAERGEASSSGGQEQSSSDADAETSNGGTDTGSTGADEAADTSSMGDEGEVPGDTGGESSEGVDPGNPLVTTPSLWYSVENRLIYIQINPDDGSVEELVASTITTPLVDGQNGITMLDDGSLVGSREREEGTQIYYIAEPPTTGSNIEVEILGQVPDNLRIEGLYTDCQGLVYLMDTGEDVGNSQGNRLLRFTGDYLAGDLSYEVITDLESASVADIDDMGPGINEMGEITDGDGYAIDTSDVYAFDYNTGTGVSIGSGGTWGVHALGGPLFTDDTARLYLLDRNARLYEADPVDLELSGVLVEGPEPEGDAEPGWSGLTGPLTECETSLPIPQ